MSQPWKAYTQLSLETRREVKASVQFLDKLAGFFDTSIGGASIHEVLLREVAPYIFEAFRQEWDDLECVHESDPNRRYYEYYGDFVPHGYFVGLLTGISIKNDFYLVEEIEIVDVVISYSEEPLEDPDELPDR